MKAESGRIGFIRHPACYILFMAASTRRPPRLCYVAFAFHRRPGHQQRRGSCRAGLADDLRLQHVSLPMVENGRQYFLRTQPSFGGLGVGLLTIALTLAFWLRERRHWLRWLGVAALLLVILQGVIGGLRVVLLENTLAIVHAAFAQAFFALTVSLAIFTSPEWNSEPSDKPITDGGRLRPALRRHHRIDLSSDYLWRRAQTYGGKSRRSFIFCRVGGAACHLHSRAHYEVSSASTEANPACVLSRSSFASSTDARRRIVFRKVHVDAWTAYGHTGTLNDDASDDRGADVGDEPAVNVESVPLFHNFQGVHRSKSFNGAVFRMSITTDTVAITGVSALRRLADFFELTKPRIVLMVLVTAFVGFYVGSEKIPDYLRLLQMLLGTALAAGGTLALNQFLERDTDAMMERTRHRPLPDGRVQPREAVWFGTAITIAGLAYLALAVNIASAWVTALITLSYLFFYTPMKRRSSLCMLVGAVPGALPPVIGWVAARGEFQVDAWVLFAIMFLWQVPHTLAIARLYREDYAKAGIQFLPVIEPDGSSTNRQIISHCAALLAVSLLPTLLGLAGAIYFLVAFVLGLGFLASGISLAMESTLAGARRLLFASLIYLPVLLLVMALDRVPL